MATGIKGWRRWHGPQAVWGGDVGKTETARLVLLHCLFVHKKEGFPAPPPRLFFGVLCRDIGGFSDDCQPSDS